MPTPIRILILSESASFPWGMAGANRVRNLAKGLLASNQCVVEYMGLRGADVAPSEDKKNRGIFEEIKYSYPGCFPVRSTNWWMRRVDDLIGACFSFTHILYKKFTGNLDAVIIYSSRYRL